MPNDGANVNHPNEIEFVRHAKRRLPDEYRNGFVYLLVAFAAVVLAAWMRA